MLCICCAATAQAFDKDYLRAIKADVAEFHTHEFQPPKGTDSWLISTGAATSEQGGQQETLEGFSRFLREESPGSYIFFRKLPLKYKRRVHADYLATGDIRRMKQNIFNYSKQARQERLHLPSHLPRHRPPQHLASPPVSRPPAKPASKPVKKRESSSLDLLMGD